VSNVPGQEPSPRAAIIAILLLALGLRIGWAVSRPVSRDELEALPDQQQYLQIAHNVLNGQGYWFLDPRVADKVYAFRMPGYPLFIAACGENVRTVRVAQAVVDASSVWAAYLLALLLFPAANRRRVALLAAALVAFNPFLVYFCGLILSETLFVAMLMWSMVLLVAGQGDQQRKRRTLLWLGGGMLLALSVLVRPSALLLAVVLGIGAAFVNRNERGSYHLRWPLPVGTTMLLWLLVVLTPWALRNDRVLHRWIWLDTNSGFTFYDGYNPEATGASDQRFVKDMPQLQHMGEVERSRYLQNLAIEWAKAHPRRVMELMRARLVRTWSPVPLSDQYSGRLYQLVGLCFSLPLDLLILWGLATAKLSRASKVFLLIPAIYLTGIHMLSVGSLRYRLPAEPPLALLAAGGLVGAKRIVNDE
jgi:hypothetical protein